MPEEDLKIGDLNNINGVSYLESKPPRPPRPLREISGPFTTRKIFSAEDAVKAIASVRTLLGIERLSFWYTEAAIEHSQKKFFFLTQLYDNIKVPGGFIQVISDLYTGEPREVAGLYMRGIKESGLVTVPTLSAKEAAKPFSLAKDTWIEDAILIICPNSYDPADGYRLAWHFRIGITFGSTTFLIREIFIDAHTGELFVDFYPADEYGENMVLETLDIDLWRKHQYEIINSPTTY